MATGAVVVGLDRGVATGWLSGRLSDCGRVLARELGHRRGTDNQAGVFTSDFRRAVQTRLILGRFGAAVWFDASD